MKSNFFVIAITALAITLSGCTKDEPTKAEPLLQSSIDGTAENVAYKYVEALFSGDVNRYLDAIEVAKQLSSLQAKQLNEADLANSFRPYILALKEKADAAGGIRKIICERSVFNTDKTTAKVDVVIKFKDPNKSDHKEIVKVNKYNREWIPALSQ